MTPAVRALVSALFVLGAAPALAQDGAIPPPATEAGRLEKERSAQQDLVREGAVSMPGVIIQGTGMLNKAMGQTGSNIFIGSGSGVGEAFSKANATVKIIEETAKDGADGFMRQGVQTVLDQGGEKVGDAAAGFLARRAVAAGVSSTLASGGASIAFTGGMMVGGYLRDSPAFGAAIGLGNRTIGDAVNDAYFNISPDSLKEWASGTPQVDINSPEFEREQLQKITARKRQAMFNRVQADNAEQQRQIDAAAAASAAANSTAAAAQAQPDSTAAILNIVRDGVMQYQQGLATQSKAAAGPVCTIDPKTGCHPGHDEKSHPGGCKCAR